LLIDRFQNLPAVYYEDVTIHNRIMPNRPVINYEEVTIPSPKPTVQLSIWACIMVVLLQFVVGVALVAAVIHIGTTAEKNMLL